jgi:hypothetical protein
MSGRARAAFPLWKRSKVPNVLREQPQIATCSGPPAIQGSRWTVRIIAQRSNYLAEGSLVAEALGRGDRVPGLPSLESNPRASEFKRDLLVEVL